jgi:hypothetical protein
MWTNMNICTSCLNHWGVTFDIYFWTGLHQWDFFIENGIVLFFAFLNLVVSTIGMGTLLLYILSLWPLGIYYWYLWTVLNEWIFLWSGIFFLIFLCLIHSSLTRHLICSLANHHTNCCDDCSLSALMSSWSLLKGKGTMGQVAVVGDVAAEQEGLAIEMESATCQPLPLKILDNSLPWVANEISPEPLSIQFWVPLIMHRKWLE